MPRKPFSEENVPAFDDAPSVILVAGDLDFFVQEAAAVVRGRLASSGAEVIRFDEDAPAGAVAEALLNRSLFAPRRVVEIDVSRVLGADSPADLAEQAFGAWERGTAAGKREAFRLLRRLLASLEVTPEGDRTDTAAAVARKIRRRDLAEPLAEMLAELPEERGVTGATLASTLRLLLGRENDGLVALLTAAAPPAGSELLSEVARGGLVLRVEIGEKPEEIASALTRLAQSRARERDIRIDPEAVARLRARTDARPALFVAELEKLLDWAGEGGQIRGADVGEQVLDESSEDVYEFFEALGKRDAADSLTRLERLFSGREIRAGNRSFDPQDGWPQIFLGMLTDEIRRMLLVRSRLEEPGAPAVDPGMYFRSYQSRVAPFLEEPVAPFGRSPFAGRASGYPFYKAAMRAGRYDTRELARALANAADVDVKLKSSAPILETLTAYVGGLIAGTH